MLIVTYDPNSGLTVPDNKLLGYAQSILTWHQHLGDYRITVGSETLITMFRVLVVRGQLAADDLTIISGDKTISVGPDGSLSDMYADSGYELLLLELL